MQNNDNNNCDATWTGTDRRKTPMPDGVHVTLEDVWVLLKEANDRLSRVEHQYGYIKSAFVENDLKKPDYDGHRRAHLQMIKSAEAVEGYKQESAKGLIKMVLAFVGGIFSIGVVEWLKNGGPK